MPVLRTPSDGSQFSDDLRRLAQRLIDTGGQSVGIRFGVDTATWAAGSNFAAVRTVTHGLGKTPLLVIVQGGQETGGPELVMAQPFTIGLTTFQYQAKFLAGAVWAAGGTHNCGWVAIG